MDDAEWLARRFEAERPHLRAVAYRMLGSLTEADDAIQDTWERVNRAGADDVQNFRGWLTTIVARVCLNMLRSRNRKREEPLEGLVPDPVVSPVRELRPEEEALLADSVGLALQVVIDTLSPAERLAFVLHDMFDLPFEEIGPIVGRTPQTTRQLASRARRRVKGAELPTSDRDVVRQRTVVDAFLAAGRAGDFDALIALLDPDVVLRADFGPRHAGRSTVLRGRGRRRRAGTPGCASRLGAPSGARQRVGGGRRHKTWASIRGDGLHDHGGTHLRDRHHR